MGARRAGWVDIRLHSLSEISESLRSMRATQWMTQQKHMEINFHVFLTKLIIVDYLLIVSCLLKSKN
jgi:hypothetical protein